MSTAHLLAWLLSVVALALVVVIVRDSGVVSRLSKAARVGVQLGSLLALYLLLFPPLQPQPANSLIVLGAGVPELPPSDPESILIALPEYQPEPDLLASTGDDIQPRRFADLASALRAFPGSTELRLTGYGLPFRDLDAAATLSIDFRPALPPVGVVKLHLPDRPVAGAHWSLSGAVAGLSEGKVELIDLAERAIARSALDDNGEFKLTARSPLAGPLLYRLRLLDAADAEVESLSVPLQIAPAEASRILLLSAAPSPEIKYLRRWAIDAGVALQSIIDLRPRLRLRSGGSSDTPTDMSEASLAQAGLLIVDDRSWLALSSGDRDRVLAAVDAGLGLLLRLTDDPDPSTRAALAGLGFVSEATELSRSVRLAAHPGALPNSASPSAPDAATSPTLQRRAVRLRAELAAALLRDADAEALGLWRPQGVGRVGVLWLSDSHKLALVGDQARHASLWSAISGTLARPPAAWAEQAWSSELSFWQDQRLQWCGLQGDAQIGDPQGHRTALSIDPDSGAERCAAYWPAQAGWHRLIQGDHAQGFYVRSGDDGVALRAQAQIDANQQLPTRTSTSASASSVDQQAPGPRWPWFLLWLLLSGMLWWLERRQTRHGNSSPQEQSTTDERR